jgi:hypothetical protein
MTSEPEEELDLSAGMVPHHPHAANPTEPPFEKGQRVVLPDGTKGRIAYLIHAMKTARVRTDDGRNLTVRHSALRAPDSVLVKQHFRRAPS